MNSRFLAVIIVLTFLCQATADPPKIVKIAVTREGNVTADSVSVTIEALDPILADLAKNKGEVWYYRESGKEEPHPNALKVLDTVIRHKLPIRLSSKPDYSDVIDDKGRSVPRQ